MAEQKASTKLEIIQEVVKIKQVTVLTDIPRIKIGSPDDAAKIIQDEIGHEDREVFLVLCLNTKNQINAMHRSHVGSINASIVHPRESFKAAILNNSSSIIIAHNHPSYDPTPSREDVDVTRRMVESGKILGIEVLDHIIVSPSSYTSLKNEGHI